MGRALPYKDPAEAREARRLSATKIRAALTGDQRLIANENDSRRKSVERQKHPMVRKPITGVAQDFSPGAHTPVDRLSYNLGSDDGRLARRGYYKTTKVRQGWNAPLPQVAQGDRRKMARFWVDDVGGALELSDNECRWLLYALRKLEWEVRPTVDAGRDTAIEAARRISATLDTLPPEARKVAAAIRRGEEWQPQSYDEILYRSRLSPREVMLGLDDLQFWRPLESHSDRDGRLVG